VSDPAAPGYFEALVGSGARDSEVCANWLTSELFGRLNALSLELSDSPVEPARLGELIDTLQAGTVHGSAAKSLLTAMVEGDKREVGELVVAMGLDASVEDGVIEQLCSELVEAHPKEADEYRGGRRRRMKFFVGQVMKQTKGQADPQKATALLERILEQGAPLR